VVIVGGGATGCETALFVARLSVPGAQTFAFLAFHDADEFSRLRRLLYDNTRTITIVEIEGRLAANVGRSTRWALLKNLRLMRVDMRLETKILSIEEDAVSTERQGKRESIAADTVVIATGSRSYGDLEPAVRHLGIDVITIGDAKEPRKISDAVREGFEAALRI
jgi:2,4-dienoyl-CoA reductase (NADPH2)